MPFIAKTSFQFVDPNFIEWKDGKTPEPVKDSKGRLLRWETGHLTPARDEMNGLIYKDISKAIRRIKGPHFEAGKSVPGELIPDDLLPKEELEDLIRRGAIEEDFDVRHRVGTPVEAAEIKSNRFLAANKKPSGYEDPR